MREISARSLKPERERMGTSDSLRKRYDEVRRATERICAPLSAEDAQIQSMPGASPAKWHLAHTTWFFETFLLKSVHDAYRPFDSSFEYLFNSYYNGVGPQFAREKRGLISRPGLREVLDYRRYVDGYLIELGCRLEDESALRLGIEHELQHQELLFTDIKHALSVNPSLPAYDPDCFESAEGFAADRSPPAAAREWLSFDGGVAAIGAEESDFSFDNERPAHRVLLEPYELASSGVTNGEYLEFIEAGGYENPKHWLSDGWQRVCAEGWKTPLYWQRECESRPWAAFTLAGLRELDEDAPVCHLSYYEADAFARWRGCRLPTEQEWENAVASEGERWRLPGTVWEWTSSAYLPYPGFEPLDGAFGEYNGKFMCNQMVLRGGSLATPRGHIRRTYRNFFQPESRWQFTGVRLARS